MKPTNQNNDGQSLQKGVEDDKSKETTALDETKPMIDKTISLNTTDDVLQELKEFQEKTDKEIDLNKRLLDAVKVGKDVGRITAILIEAKKAKENKEIDSLSPLLKDKDSSHSGWTAMHWIFYHDNLHVINDSLLKYLGAVCRIDEEMQETTDAPWFNFLGVNKLFGFNGNQTPAHIVSKKDSNHSAEKILSSLESKMDQNTQQSKDALGYLPGEARKIVKTSWGSYFYSMATSGYSFFNSATTRVVSISKSVGRSIASRILKSDEDRVLDGLLGYVKDSVNKVVPQKLADPINSKIDQEVKKFTK